MELGRILDRDTIFGVYDQDREVDILVVSTSQKV